MTQQPPTYDVCRVVTQGPCIGMCVQKFDDREHHEDAWRDVPSQRVGVAVNSDSLLKIYRDTIVDYDSNRRKLSRL